MESSLLPVIQELLDQLAVHATAYQVVPREPPSDDSEDLKSKVVSETGRLVTELNDGSTTSFGTNNTYFGHALPEENRSELYAQVQRIIEELHSANASDSVETVLESVSGGMSTLKDAIIAGQLPANLVLKGIETYVKGPIDRWLGADASSKQISDDVQALVTEETELKTAYEKDLAEAESRVDRQSIKAQHFQQREQFFTKALAKLEEHIESDKSVVSSLETKGTPEIQDALKTVQSLVKESVTMRQHVRSKGLSYSADPAQLQHKAETLTHKLSSNSELLNASLAETLRLLQEHTDLQTQLTNVKMEQKIRNQVEVAVEANRSDLLGAIDAETSRLSATQDAVNTFLGVSQTFVEEIRSICDEQRKQATERTQKNSKFFADLYQEYYQQLQELHAGKVKCMKALQVELKRLLKEQSRWEELEHELPGAQQLIKLDDRLNQIKEFQSQLSNEIDALVTKLDTLKGCGADILSKVPGFVHPSEAFAKVRAEQLHQKRQQLESMLLKFGPIHFTNEDLNYDSSSTEAAAEPTRPIGRHVCESPYKLKRHLQRVTDEIRSSPFASQYLQIDVASTLPEVEGPQVPEPSAEMLRLAREARRAPETRGSPLPSKKRRRKAGAAL